MRDHSLAQLWPFITKDREEFNSVGEAQEAIANHETELTRIAKIHLELCRG